MRVFRASRVPPLFSGRRDGCVRMFRYECVKWVEAGIGLDSERYMGTQTPKRRLFYLHARGKRVCRGITCYFRRVAMYLLKTS